MTLAALLLRAISFVSLSPHFDALEVRGAGVLFVNVVDRR